MSYNKIRDWVENKYGIKYRLVGAMYIKDYLREHLTKEIIQHKQEITDNE